jgi:hypothetical protein
MEGCRTGDRERICWRMTKMDRGGMHGGGGMERFWNHMARTGLECVVIWWAGAAWAPVGSQLVELP